MVNEVSIAVKDLMRSREKLYLALAHDQHGCNDCNDRHSVWSSAEQSYERISPFSSDRYHSLDMFFDVSNGREFRIYRCARNDSAVGLALILISHSSSLAEYSHLWS